MGNKIVNKKAKKVTSKGESFSGLDSFPEPFLTSVLP